MVGTVSTNLSDYYIADGAGYRVYARVAQAADATSETLSTNRFYAATNTAANTPTHPATNAGPDRHASPGSHRTTNPERADAAAGRGRRCDRGRPLAACRCTPR